MFIKLLTSTVLIKLLDPEPDPDPNSDPDPNPNPEQKFRIRIRIRFRLKKLGSSRIRIRIRIRIRNTAYYSLKYGNGMGECLLQRQRTLQRSLLHSHGGLQPCFLHKVGFPD